MKGILCCHLFPRPPHATVGLGVSGWMVCEMQYEGGGATSVVLSFVGKSSRTSTDYRSTSNEASFRLMSFATAMGLSVGKHPGRGSRRYRLFQAGPLVEDYCPQALRRRLILGCPCGKVPGCRPQDCPPAGPVAFKRVPCLCGRP